MTSQTIFPSLTNHFLVAMPKLEDPNFFQTVTLICQHDENGALGVVINRPIESLALYDVLSQLDLGAQMSQPEILEPVYAGGPVHNELGLVLHEGLGAWQSTIPVGEHMGLTSSRDVLESMVDGTGPKNALLSLGYAGWGAGQLESEIYQNSWLTVKAQPYLVFDTPPHERWEKSMEAMGLDLSRLVSEAGHA
ncbi:MAG: YqgE/AlgH family protein [Acidiferrobacteraceae bacterium]|nr:YqgE/AlgH family protein [Acidiferrobacteraceae bacterium]